MTFSPDAPFVPTANQSIDVYRRLCLEFEHYRRSERAATVAWLDWMISQRYCLITGAEAITGVYLFRPCDDLLKAGTNEYYATNINADSIWIDVMLGKKYAQFIQPAWDIIGYKKVCGYCRRFNGKMRVYSSKRLENLSYGRSRKHSS